ncbi:MAG: nitroreductase [bacterium]|nr:nitroreductase [bacterium]
MQLDKAIMERRSVRKFTDDYVPNDQLKEVLEAARNAPSWANTQVWEFVIVRDREVINQVTETYSEKNPARKCSFSASALIMACAKTKVSGCRDEEERTKFMEWFMFDLGLAVQNLCLKAHEIGLGTVIVGSMDHETCAKILGMPQGYEVVASIPIGKPAVVKKDGPPRKELKKFVRLDTFNEFFNSIDS